MQNRYLLGGLVIFLLLAGGYFVWHASAPKHYSSNDLGLSFSYPSHYFTVGHTEETPERTWSVLVLQDTNATPTPQNSEAPPTITVIVFNNIEKESLTRWVHGSSFSNFKLSNGSIASSTIGGEPALTYQYSGLYENDAAVVMHGGKIYFFSAGWLTDKDPIRQDFHSVLNSVHFNP